MRSFAFSVLICCLAFGLSGAEDTPPPVRRATHIAAQPLGPALEELAAGRGLQVLYLSEIVRGLQTQGATGDLSADEAFEMLLRGTGLAYRRVDRSTISVFPLVPEPKEAAAPPEKSRSVAPPHDEAAVPQVTVSAEREAIERRVRAFVRDVMEKPFDGSFARWGIPVCPEVAGMEKAATEFAIARIVAIAKGAGAPVAARNCRTNLVVIVATEPAAVLKRWYARNGRIFGDATGRAIDAFMNAPQPVRVWYNIETGHASGLPFTVNCPAMQGAAGPTTTGEDNCQANDTRVIPEAVRTITSVIVKVDRTRAGHVQLGQLTDYAALVGLAEIRADAAVGSAPSILRLFSSSPADRPAGLSAWDAALLKALYRAAATSRTQRPQIEQSIVQDVAP